MEEPSTGWVSDVVGNGPDAKTDITDLLLRVTGFGKGPQIYTIAWRRENPTSAMAGRRRHGGLEYRASSREQSRVTFSPGLAKLG